MLKFLIRRICSMIIKNQILHTEVFKILKDMWRFPNIYTGDKTGIVENNGLYTGGTGKCFWPSIFWIWVCTTENLQISLPSQFSGKWGQCMELGRHRYMLTEIICRYFPGKLSSCENTINSIREMSIYFGACAFLYHHFKDRKKQNKTVNLN